MESIPLKLFDTAMGAFLSKKYDCSKPINCIVPRQIFYSKLPIHFAPISRK